MHEAVEVVNKVENSKLFIGTKTLKNNLQGNKIRAYSCKILLC